MKYIPRHIDPDSVTLHGFEDGGEVNVTRNSDGKYLARCPTCGVTEWYEPSDVWNDSVCGHLRRDRQSDALLSNWVRFLAPRHPERWTIEFIDRAG